MGGTQDTPPQQRSLRPLHTWQRFIQDDDPAQAPACLMKLQLSTFMRTEPGAKSPTKSVAANGCSEADPRAADQRRDSGAGKRGPPSTGEPLPPCPPDQAREPWRPRSQGPGSTILGVRHAATRSAGESR
ncbi:hypothetical protein GDO81_001200 [Engystomops pustulosus]|uniref:Uncharacterized protein n=1 Tax=Engystomops pustulosus TaxID=76066 RepID=A0AAV7DB83_ENGPU|nr:hypothetical protein GDO81_001200 [Engystomops pustulosus]